MSQNRTWMYWLFQGALFMFPLFIMWSHFKYMRLENSVKAVYFVTYIIKMLFLIMILLLLFLHLMIIRSFTNRKRMMSLTDMGSMLVEVDVAYFCHLL